MFAGVLDSNLYLKKSWNYQIKLSIKIYEEI